MGAMSRRKGSAFERAIAKQMSEWVGFKVSRTPSSGAYGTREGWSSLSGDLMFEREFPFYCELKCRESWGLDDILSEKGEFWNWALATWDQAAEHGKRPLLIVKRNRQPAYVFVSNDDTVNNQTVGLPFVFCPDSEVGDLVGYRFDDFIKSVNPRLL